MSNDTPLTETNKEVNMTNILLSNTLLGDLLSNFFITKNTQVKLEPKAVIVLKRVLVDCPILIDNIDVHIKAIVSDNIIDAKDIPQIILMLKEVINVNIKDLKAISLTRQEAVTLIETIIFILLDLNVIKCGNNKDELMVLLKLSVQLLDSSIDLSNSINCTSWWCC